MYDTGTEIINYQLRNFYHANLQHLLSNTISFYGLSFIEDIIGTPRFIGCIVFISIVSSLLLYIYHNIFTSRKVVTVGFSGVIFGLLVVYFTLLQQGTGLTIANLAISILPQIFVSGISWEGHVSGIVAGFIYVTLFPV